MTATAPGQVCSTVQSAAADSELFERLVACAEAAIRNEAPGILYDRSRLRGIHVELEIRNNGGIIGGDCYVQRAANLSRLLRPAPAPAERGAR
jgi:hypothetical protein